MQPITVYPQDTVTLYYDTAFIHRDGREELIEHKKVLESSIDKEMTLTEGVIFEVESGDFAGAKSGIGGAFLESEEL